MLNLPIHWIAHERSQDAFQNRDKSLSKPKIFLFQIEDFIHNY